MTRRADIVNALKENPTAFAVRLKPSTEYIREGLFASLHVKALFF